MTEGPVASRSFASLQAHDAKHNVDFVRFNPSLAYLKLNSLSLQPMLGSLFNNSRIAKQLGSRYGLLKEVARRSAEFACCFRAGCAGGWSFQGCGSSKVDAVCWSNRYHQAKS